MRFAILTLAGALLGTGTLGPAPLAAADVAPGARATARTTPPIVEAARDGDAPTVRRLLAQKANVNEPAGDGMTALHWAAYHGNVELAQLLVRAKASLTATTRLGDNTPLHIAARHGHGAVVALLASAGAAPDARTTGGATALHLAAAAGDTVAMRALVRAKADLNAREQEWGQTPLMFAAANDRGAAVRLLLAAGADPSVRTEIVNLTTRTAREQAAARKRNQVMFAFLPQAVKDSILQASAPAAGAPAAPAAVAAPTTGTVVEGGGGATATADPLARAALRAPPTQYLTAVQIQMAIDSGRAVLAAAEAATGPLVSDTTDGQVFGFEATVGGMGGLTALHHAVRQGNAAATLALLDGGADINLQTVADSTSPLLLAIINGHFDLAMQLVERGADVNIESTDGLAPLYAAINAQWLPKSRFPQPQSIQLQKTSHLELMTAILDRGADVNKRLKKNLWFFGFNNCGNANCGLEFLDSTSAFWRAAYAVDVEAMRLLKARGADHTLPSRRVAPPRRAPGGELGGDELGGGGGGARAAAGAGGPAGAAAPAAGGASIDEAARARLAAAAAARAATPALDPATDSAARAVPPGIGVYPIHAAAGVGYGNGFAGNAHRHAPDGWMPAIRYLVEELGADVNARDNNGHTPLHHAAARGDNEMIQYLVSKGADVRAVSRRGQTTVDMANGPVQRLRPYPETIRLLESLGAKNSNRCVGC
jgi:ankyrin repeat protein